MRLVDADALLERMRKDPLFYLVEKYGISGVIKYEPTVEAIPVDWLLNHIPNDEVMHRYNEKLIEYLIVGWRKENETVKSDGQYRNNPIKEER